MEANELMIGDWVEVPFLEGKPKIVKVEEILFDEINPEWDGMENYGGVKIKYVKPIPLTSEILEKNEFTKEYGVWVIYRHPSFKWFVLYKKEFGYAISVGESKVNINYVHELQHALKLCGIDKTIEL